MCALHGLASHSNVAGTEQRLPTDPSHVLLTLTYSSQYYRLSLARQGTDLTENPMRLHRIIILERMPMQCLYPMHYKAPNIYVLSD